MNATEEITLPFHCAQAVSFPNDIKTEEQVRAFLSEVTGYGIPLKEKALAALRLVPSGVITEENELVWETKLEYALTEALSNVLLHDMMGFSGGIRTKVLPTESDYGVVPLPEKERAAELQKRIDQARGCTSSLFIDVTETEMIMVQNLSYPFTNFGQMIEKARREPTEEELLLPTGRGLMIILSLLPEAEYDEVARTLTYKNSGLTLPKEDDDDD